MEAESRLEKPTISVYRAASARLLASIGDISIGALTRSDVRSAIWLTELESPSQARIGLISLRSALAAAVHEGVIEWNAASQQNLAPRQNRQTRVMSDDEVRALKTIARESAQVKGSPGSVILRRLIDILFDTGMVISEALALRYGDFRETPDGHLVVRVSGTLASRGEMKLKEYSEDSSKNRVLDISDRVADWVRDEIAVATDGPVFESTLGGWVHPNSVNRWWRKMVRGTGLEWVTPHTCRATVKAALVSQFGVAVASTLMGYTNTR
ncbi:tyrosine-type recombinase/integrase [Pseudactinotalea sp. HY160]|uniref:tyrosine-type recombinase/integrase n=1 Tax=Pseudactinotalea sp. HY160 TaxID=2654490 RepID=UPI0018838842|nr:tyrosine-type recombinase/integrase [Pseudactinotalea sp. HY160]